MKFKVSFCDPLNPEILEMGDFEDSQIMEIFDNIPWIDYLEEVDISKIIEDDEINVHYSPSLEIENHQDKSGIEVSAINEEEWCIIYRRPYSAKNINHTKPTGLEYMTEISEQTINEVRNCINAFTTGDLEYLEKMVK